MKVSLSSMLVATAIAAASGLAYSQTAQPVQNSQGSGTTMSQPAMSQPMAATTGYDALGPQPGGSTASGRGRDGAPCIVGLSCDIYRGN